MHLDIEDHDLITLTSSASLAEVPGKNNWIEHVPGSPGLPPYVRKLARGIMKSGKSKSSAIAIAISRIKKWAAGLGDVKADTRAKAAAALAQWEALKAKNAAKKVALSTGRDGHTYLMLTNDANSFRIEYITEQFRKLEEYADFWVAEMWSDKLIAQSYDASDGEEFLEIPYTVTNEGVDFGEPVPVRREYVSEEEVFTDNELELLAEYLPED